MTDEIKHEDREHVFLSPSSSARWMNCPGSVALAKTLPEKPPGPWAEEGTRAHELAEAALHQGDHVLEDADPDMAEAVKKYLDYIDLLMDPEATLYIETRVHFENYVPEGSGTCDAIIVGGDGRTMHVVDYKHGQGVPVDAWNNTQLMLYALGAIGDLGFLYPDIETVDIHIVQPRTPGAVASSQSWSVTDLLKWAEDVLVPAAAEAWEAYNDGPARLNPGEKQCRFCPVAGICPAQALSVLQAAQEDVRTLEPEELGPLMEKAAEAKLWADALETAVFANLSAGKPVPGYKLVHGRARRAWALSDEEMIAALKSTRKPVDDIAPRSPLSPAQAEKYFKELPQKIADLIIKSAGKPTVVPESDKRDAIVIDVTEGFEIEGETE